MIANVIDVTDQYTSYVQLTFKHCLFAVNFVVNNLNEASTTIDDFIFKVNDIILCKNYKDIIYLFEIIIYAIIIKQEGYIKISYERKWCFMTPDS